MKKIALPRFFFSSFKGSFKIINLLLNSSTLFAILYKVLHKILLSKTLEFFFLKVEFQPMASALDDYPFIRTRHYLVFGVGVIFYSTSKDFIS